MGKIARTSGLALFIFLARDLLVGLMRTMDGYAEPFFTTANVLGITEALVAAIALAWLRDKDLDLVKEMLWAGAIGAAIRLPSLVVLAAMVGRGQMNPGAPFWVDAAAQAAVLAAACAAGAALLAGLDSAMEARRMSRSKPVQRG